MSTTETSQEMCKKAEPQKEHNWLTKLVGDWTMEAECFMGPDQPPVKTAAKETVRDLGGLWIVADGTMEVPNDGHATTVMTVGYSPDKKRFVGSWVGSMMTHMWVYDGELDSTETVLTLNAEGPSFTDPTKQTKYQDIIEIVSDDHRVLKSRYLGEDGQWSDFFMTAHYRRCK